MLRTKLAYGVLLLTMTLGTGWTAPAKMESAPSFSVKDIRGQDVDLDQVLATRPDMAIIYFFTTEGGEEITRRLKSIEMWWGRDKVQIIAFGVKEEEAALKQFADKWKIDYCIVANEQVERMYGPITSLPLTFILMQDKTVVKVIRGSGETAGAILSKVAETYLQQGKNDEASAIADVAKAEGEDAVGATEIKGFALAAAGKLDEAEDAFGLISSNEGLASVAYERGEYAKAIDLANQAGPQSGYAATVKGKALLKTGDFDGASAALNSATQKSAGDWKDSQAFNAQGRLLQEQGATEEALDYYQQAQAMDPFNVVALSNEGAAHRAAGDLDKASAVLEKAQTLRDDDLVAVMLEQVRAEMAKANDVKRGELIRAQIAELTERFQAMKEAGTDKPVDPWSSRPLVLAFLPGANKTHVFFERAGTDVVLRRELESQVQAAGAATVVEREMLDILLQELNLGSSELANPDTQLQLGKVLSAQLLGFIDFAQAGPDTLMYLRMVDTETTEVPIRLTRNIKDAANIMALAEALAQEMLAKVAEERPLKGLIGDASSDDAVIINLGNAHGVKPGLRFKIIEEGDSIEVGGKVIGYKSKRVGLLEVTEVEDGYSTCKVVKKEAGAQLAKEMKIEALK